MNVKEMIEINNAKRKQLSEENRKYYEEMLVYIRLSYNKSEVETEEILSDMLNHLLEAQLEGKNATDVFEDNPKAYADEIIGELPKMITKERFLLSTMGILYFIGVSTFLSGVFSIISHYVFNFGAIYREFHLVSVIIKTIVSIPIAFILLYIILQYLRWACFKKVNKIAEFFFFWVYGMLSIGMFLVIFLVTPDVGRVVEISMFVIIVIGIVLYLFANMIKNKLDNEEV
ncbi:MAG: DUF1129 family protein [Anaerobacillus sp.]|uniref:DUF1129 family protein n=1 Tax=Anaerobacillus sp. TaxID=1872506 RepID=UPI00391B81A4